jgi:hypothetical protein
MYLVSPEEYLKNRKQQQASKAKMSPSKRRVKRKTKKKKPQNARHKWFLMRNAMHEAEINRKSLIRAIADIFKRYYQALPPSPPPHL